MNITDNLRRQHTELLQIAGEINGLLDSLEQDEALAQLMRLLATFAGKLQIHLSMEDKSLYPHLLKSDRHSVASLSNEFMKEMGHLSEVFVAYREKWMNSTAIRENTPMFVKETRNIFETLTRRIVRENTILYPAIEDL